MQQPITNITELDDPRLNLPFVTIYDQKSLGCSFFLFCLLPILPVIYSVVAQNEGIRLAQYGILILTALWVITIVSNRNYVEKIRKTAQPGQATLVEKFIDITGDTITKTLVYTFNAINENGENTQYQTRVSVATQDEFDVPLGHVIKFSSVPMKSHLNSVINHLPFMWIRSGLDGFRKKINRWTFMTSFIMFMVSLLAIWTRAALLATSNIWLEFSLDQAITPILQAALSSEPLPYFQSVLITMPALPLVGATALYFMMLSLVPYQE